MRYTLKKYKSIVKYAHKEVAYLRKFHKRLLCLLFLLLPLWVANASEPLQNIEESTVRSRALLIANDFFVNHKSTQGACQNNAEAVYESLKNNAFNIDNIERLYNQVASPESFSLAVQKHFKHSDDNDINILYISTHGIFEQNTGVDAALILSDGINEDFLSAHDIFDAFGGIKGKNVLIIDACYSGALIGKGVRGGAFSNMLHQNNFYVLASSGGSEESWYWAENQSNMRLIGAGYFSAAFTRGISRSENYPADINKNGNITLHELYDFLYQSHAASVVQCYPQDSEEVLFTYHSLQGDAIPTIHHLVFYNDSITTEEPSLNFSFQLEKPIVPLYQIVYYKNGKWDFNNAEFNYDPGALGNDDEVRPLPEGTHRRKIALNTNLVDNAGYALINIYAREGRQLKFVNSRIIAILKECDLNNLHVITDFAFQPMYVQEMPIIVNHTCPCYLEVNVRNKNGELVYELSGKRLTRPENMQPTASTFFWHGKLKNGDYADAGEYYIECIAEINGQKTRAFSKTFTLLPHIY